MSICGRFKRRHGSRSAGAPRRRRGLTIIELLLVAVVVSILAALAGPMLGDTNQTKLEAAAQLLMADLAFAQMESIAHPDDPRVLVLDLTANAYHIAAASDTTTPITNPIDKAPYRVEFGMSRAAQLKDVTIASASLGGDSQVQFGMYGQTDQTSTATITLGTAGGSATGTVSIDPTTGETTYTPGP